MILDIVFNHGHRTINQGAVLQWRYITFRQSKNINIYNIVLSDQTLVTIGRVLCRKPSKKPFFP
jgi:hypothetical protein